MDLLRHLHHFAVVAEELHFGRAAEVLGIAQPPLSQSIQRLERELDVRLFDRSRRQVGLTPAGRLLLDEARGLLAAEQRMRAVMLEARDGTIGVLRVGVPPETPAVALQALLRRLADQAPGLGVDLRELTTSEQMRMLADARLDVGLVHHPVDAPGVRFGPAARTRLGVVLTRASPLARRTELALADLVGHDLLLPPRATTEVWYDHVLSTCRRHGFEPARIRHARNSEFVLGLLLAGHAVAFEPESSALREPRVVWRRVAGDVLDRTTSAAFAVRSPHPAAERFAEIAVAALGDAPEPMGVPPADAARPWNVVFAPHPADSDR